MEHFQYESTSVLFPKSKDGIFVFACRRLLITDITQVDRRTNEQADMLTSFQILILVIHIDGLYGEIFFYPSVMGIKNRRISISYK